MLRPFYLLQQIICLEVGCKKSESIDRVPRFLDQIQYLQEYQVA